MSFRIKPLNAALALAYATAFVAAPALAQNAPQRIEITGSAIKRIDSELPVPVEVVTRAQIERTGATSINELLKSVAVIDIFDQGELASNSPGGSGTARVRLRGLGDTQTLVLINGRRVPTIPLQDATGAGAAFNINQIPVSAIERMEILKDGGSAIYGADAVAGVVNFILRRDFTGAAGKLEYGISSRDDGEEKHATLTTGFGNLANQRFNIMGALDVFKREPIYRKDREISRSVDFRRFGPIVGFPNLDGRSSFAPEGNILNAQGGVSGQTVRPCPPENFTANACRYDFNASVLTAYNGADRVSGLVGATWQATDAMLVTLRAIGSKSKDHFEAHPVPDAFTLPDGRRYNGRFMQGGPRITDREDDFLHLEGGIEGTLGSFDYKVGVSRGKAETTNADRNYFDRARYTLATQGDPANGIAPTIDPTVTTNSEAVIESLRVYPVRRGESILDFADAQVSGDLFRLPGGTARFAVGLNAWNEENKDNPDPIQIAGTVVGSIQQSAVAAERDAYAVFGELMLPITKGLEAQLAVRYDHYDTASRTSPKAAVKWQVVPGFALRGSYAESFKMPTLKQLYANAGQGAINLTESQCTAMGLAAGCGGLPAFRLTGSNPNLKPETGKTYNLGFVVEAGPASVSLDWWRIDKKDNIVTPIIEDAIRQGSYTFDQTLSRYIVNLQLQNFAVSENEGVDLDAQFRLRNTPVGNLTVRGNATYYMKIRNKPTPGAPWDEFVGIYGQGGPSPRWRTALTVTSEMGPWTLQGLIRGWAGMYDSGLSGRQLPAGVRKIPAYDEVDLMVAWSGIKGLKLAGSVKNVFDRMPPFAAANGTNNITTQQGFAEVYTSRGRFYQVSAEYAF
jgi:iron complex outermembrane receptor protein